MKLYRSNQSKKPIKIFRNSPPSNNLKITAGIAKKIKKKSKSKTKKAKIDLNKKLPKIEVAVPKKTAKKYPHPGRPKQKSGVNLNEREQCFADMILENLHKTGKQKLPDYKIYMKSHPSCTKIETAMVRASKLKSLPKIRKYIDKVRAAATKRVELTVERVLTGLIRIAEFDPRKLYDLSGKFKGIHKLDDDTALGIAGLKFNTYKIKTRSGLTKYKMNLSDIRTESRKAAWELLGNYLDMFNKDNNPETPKDFVNEIRDFADQIKDAVPGGII